MPEVTSRDRTMGTYRRAAPLFVGGEGAWMHDAEGRRFLDLISGIGANSLGHGHPRLAAALAGPAGQSITGQVLYADAGLSILGV